MKQIESTVLVGRHQKAYGVNHQCGAYISPYLTLKLIQKYRIYAEDYHRESKSPNYRGVIPYIGSNND